MSLNAFMSKAATSAVIVGHSSKDLEFLLTTLLERHFRLCAHWFTLFHFFLVTMEEGALQVD